MYVSQVDRLEAANPGKHLPEDEAGAQKQGQSGYRSSAIAWLSSGFVLAQTLMIRVLLDPIQRTLHQALEASSANWERQELAKAAMGLPRRTLLGIASAMVLESRADAQLRNLFEEST